MGRALGQSATPHEALLKRCSHFTLDFEDADHVAHADEACDLIKVARERDLLEATRDLQEGVAFAADLHAYLTKNHEGRQVYEEDDAERKRWVDWLQDVFKPRTSMDRDVTALIQRIVTECGLAADEPKSRARTKANWSEVFVELVAELREIGKKDDLESRKEQTWKMRAQITTLRRLQKELATRIRSLRFYNAVRDVQSGVIDPTSSLSSPHALSGAIDEPLGILSCCGHTGPLSVISEAARRQVCVETDCNAAVRLTSVVRADQLLGEQTHTVFGTKLEQVVDLIDSLPKKERILVFVQFPDLLDKVGEALNAHEVDCLTISGAAQARSNALHTYQTATKGARVLLLNLGDASASGACALYSSCLT